MPTEVADSDADSDLESPSEFPPNSTEWPAGEAPSEPGNGCRVSLSDFPQQSDRSDAVAEWPSCNEGAEISAQNGSTLEQDCAVGGRPGGQYKTETAPSASALKSNKKRRHTELEDGSLEADTKTGSTNKDRKRRKTYGSGGPRLKSSQSDRFEGLICAEDEQDFTPHPIGRFFEPNNREPPTKPPAPESLHDDDEELRHEHHKQRLASIGSTNSPYSNVTQEVSTSRSSIGNYQSINIDLRGSGKGASANPFCSLSQTYLEEDVVLKSGNGIDNGTAQAHRAKSIDPLLLYHGVPHDTQVLSSSVRKRRKTDSQELETFMSSGDVRPIQRSASVASSAPVAKKRGRKPKEQKGTSKSPSTIDDQGENPAEEEAAIGLLKELYKPRPSKSRGGKNERLSWEPSQASEARSDVPKTKKRKKADAAEDSPVKEPTSELHLSDEAYVGLPKEQYEPRPSRSRSKRTIDEEDTPQPELEVSVPAEGGNQNEKQLQELTHQFATPAKPKKSAKKTAVKRGKTMMPKKGQAMFSDGEDDVVWLETQPNKVKLDLPGDISPEKAIKQEPIASSKTAKHDCAIENSSANEFGPEAHCIEGQTTATKATSHIIVDIPLLTAKTALKETRGTGPSRKIKRAVNDNDEDDSEADSSVESPDNEPKVPAKSIAKNPEPKKGRHTTKSAEKITDGDTDDAEVDSVTEAEEEVAPGPKPEPKKRGRKKKDAAPLIAQDKTIPASKAEASPTVRPALAHKSPNIPSATTEASSPTKDRSPSNGNGGKPAETPEKKSSLDPEKGPTKHSPINPAGGKALYRVGLSRRAAIQPLLKIVRK